MTVHGSNEQSEPPMGAKAAAVYRQFPELQPSALPGDLKGPGSRRRVDRDPAAATVARGGPDR
jgi:hypothetical protein